MSENINDLHIKLNGIMRSIEGWSIAYRAFVIISLFLLFMFQVRSCNQVEPKINEIHKVITNENE